MCKFIKLSDELEDLKNGINDISFDFSNDYNATNSDYMCDAISEFADGYVDIYNSDLFDWAKVNYNVIEDANSEFGTPEDILQQIRQGQFYQYNNQLYEDIDDIIKILAINYIIDKYELEEIGEATFDEIMDTVSNIDNNNYISDIANAVNEVLEG